MNWYLIIVAIVLAVVILVCTGLIIIYFGHEADKNTAWFPRLVTVCFFCWPPFAFFIFFSLPFIFALQLFGLFIVFASVLVLPFDVANARDGGGGLRIDLLWQIMYLALAALVFIVVPFAFFYYESTDFEFAHIFFLRPPLF